ncbi:cephalosporin hydroxylase family protein [Brevundimonas sp.]|uniref:cephalosporin hydroxylase family protein n=1 Tax=Brevundimonas sp. TaxID=1871086 RepID=UPI002FCB4D9F
MRDDRAEFLEHARRQSIAMGADTALFERSIETLLDVDRYDYAYLWTWMGVPIIQLPADIMATQEVMWATRPTVIIEAGVARGGSLIMMNSILKQIGGGKVIGIDIDIRAHNRESIESHPMADGIVLIEGSSTEQSVIDKVKSEIRPDDRVMVVLDSDHSRDHVLAELRAFGPLVTEGCYMVVADTAAGFLTEDQAPRRRSKVWYNGDEPLSAARDYLAETDRFVVDPAINGKLVMASSPQGYLKCVKA